MKCASGSCQQQSCRVPHLGAACDARFKSAAVAKPRSEIAVFDPLLYHTLHLCVDVCYGGT